MQAVLLRTSTNELDRLAVGACEAWRAAYAAGTLAHAGDLSSGAWFLDISGNRRQRFGFIKDDRDLGCKNRKEGGEVDYCCTFAVVAPENHS